MKTLRVFISSPDDVHEERNLARDEVNQLSKRYAGRLKLQPLLWEELPLSSHMNFQDGIEVVLSERGVDIAVFILWSRLGSPTGPLMGDDQNRPYRSGTEREWYLMLEARRECDKKGVPPRPDIFVYTRQDEVSFVECLRGKPDEEKAKKIDQKRLVSQFIKEEFHDADTGVNIRAYRTYDRPITFVEQLRTHLTNRLDKLAGDDLVEAVWNIADRGPPYRGLEAFEYRDAPIFFGREDEIVSIRTQLREQACRGCAFVLISGPSGSGKSSLARAGVLPDVCNYEVDTDVRQWRPLVLKPSQLGDDPLGGLVKSLTAEGVLPELRVWAADIVVPQDSSAFPRWLTAFGLRVGDALKEAGDVRGTTRLILLLDQMEELFSGTTISEKSRQQLFEALEILARSGAVWVVATVRSDFYHRCQTLPALLRMKVGAGQFDLVPPNSGALSRLITGPALLAGLQFERDSHPESQQTLADTILRDATAHKELLPLVEYLLLELCKDRTENGILTFEHFRTLGGVEGALRKRCEETFDNLSPAAQASLDEVLAELVTLSGDGHETFVRRTVPLDRFTGDPVQRELIDSMVEARLFTTASGPEGDSVISVAHEALLRVWPRATKWIVSNRDHLRFRARVEQSQQRWKEQRQDDSLLLPTGLPLNEARQLLVQAPHLLSSSSSTRNYIEASIRFHDAHARQLQRRRRVMATTAFMLFIVVSWFAWEARGRLRAHGVMQAIYAAVPEELQNLINLELPSLRRWADEELQKVAKDSSALADKRLRASLAALPNDPTQIEYLEQRLLDCSFDEFPVIRDMLKNTTVDAKKHTLIGKLQHCLSNAQEDGKRRLLAGMALASLDGSKKWTVENTRFLTDTLLSTYPEYQPQLRDYLTPVATQLIPHLKTAFENEKERESVRLAAANALAQYLSDDLVEVSALLTKANPEQYAILYSIVGDSRPPEVIDFLAKLADTQPSDELGSAERVAHGQRRANAAVTLARLGELEKFMPVFNMTDDPEALTQFIFRCRPREVGVEALLNCLELVSAAPQRYPVNTRYTLLLALGEYSLDEISKPRQELLLKQLTDWYRDDPNSGVHGASGWLLRNWGQTEVVRQIDHQTATEISADREWFTLAIKVNSTASPLPAIRRTEDVFATFATESEANPQPPPPTLSTKTFYYTFIVFPAGEYMIGSVNDEPYRETDEVRHPVKLTRPFALLDREITFEELIAAAPQYAEYMQKYHAKPGDAAFAVSWYDSVRYCRWLGEPSGMVEADQSYPDPKSLDTAKYRPEPYGNGARQNWPLRLGRRGFRLPTEAEWEVACRAGARTAYGYGNDVGLGGRFGWSFENSGYQVHSPRELRPNIRGLFDMHGNVSEWAHDLYGRVGFGRATNPLGAESGEHRVLRSGDWDSGVANDRSARRNAHGPTYRTVGHGFRLALSLTGVVPGVVARAGPEGGGTEGTPAEQRPELP